MRDHVDLYLAPPVGHYGTFEAGAFDRIVDAGYRHARDRLGELRSDGRLSLAPVSSEAHDPSATFLWAVAEGEMAVGASSRPG